MTSPLLLLSIRPVHGEHILRGDKTVELRRRPPRRGEHTLIMLYLSSPVRAIVGIARTRRVLADTPARLWERIGVQAAVSRSLYERYFSDARVAYALELEQPERLTRPVPLSALRERWHGFHPPQSFRYVHETSSPESIHIHTASLSLSVALGAGLSDAAHAK